MILNDVDRHFRRSLVETNRRMKKMGLKIKMKAQNKKSEFEIYSESFNELQKDLNSIPSENSLSDQNCCVLYKSKQDFKLRSLEIDRSVTNYNKNFTGSEEYKLSELVQLLRPVVNGCNKNYILFDIKDVSQMVKTGNYFYEREITNYINAIKKMNVFGDICENDRIALVKYSCLDILCLRVSVVGLPYGP